MHDKKIVRQNTSRLTVQQKLKEALAKKPTASWIANQNLPAEQLNKIIDAIPESTQRLVERRVRNAKNRKRFTRPLTAGPIYYREPFEAPNHHIYETPDWFTLNSESVDVSIIVPCFKSAEVIQEQIASWKFDDDGLTKEIIYVDDACPFHSRSAILEAWKKRDVKRPIGKIILNHKNGGFGFSCNTGAQHAKGKYLIFLNADTTVTPGWIRPLYDCFKDPTMGIVGNLHLKGDGTIDSCGSEWDWGTNSFVHVGKHIYHKKTLNKPFRLENIPLDLLQPHEVEMVTGACFMIPKKLFERIGGFDLEYRIGYWEDADLCMKVHANGYKVYYTPESRIFHKGNHTHSGAHTYMSDNQMIFNKKWVETKILQGYLNDTRPNTHKLRIPKDKMVVYTSITGNYDILKEQPASAREGVDFVAFLDKPIQTATWQVRGAHNEFKDPNRNAKIHKILSHIYFPEKEYSLWVDGSVTIEFNFPAERLAEIFLNDADIALFRHSERNCLYQEANVCIQRRLDDPEIIRNQVKRYTQEGYPSNVGLGECTILLRRHNQKVREFNEAWWEEIKRGSKRDQISFNYVARKLGVKIRYFPGNLRKKNYLFSRDEHKR